MARTKTVAEHAADHLRENGHDGVMWGDEVLLHEIAERAGKKHEGWRTSLRVLNCLERSPLFVKKYLYLHRRVRSFVLKEREDAR